MVFRRKLSRAQLLKFIAAQSSCVVAMEAYASSHHWGRAIGNLDHKVRLIPPDYVKPFVKRQKNDMADAEAIADGVQLCVHAAFCSTDLASAPPFFARRLQAVRCASDTSRRS